MEITCPSETVKVYGKDGEVLLEADILEVNYVIGQAMESKSSISNISVFTEVLPEINEKLNAKLTAAQLMYVFDKVTDELADQKKTDSSSEESPRTTE